MKEGATPEEAEQRARDQAIASIEVVNLPHVGPARIGRWTGIGIARKAVMDALGLSAEEAAAAIGLHLGTTIAFRFAKWHVVASIKIDDYRAQPMLSFGAASGTPNFENHIFNGLFFYGDRADHLQWSTGSFGGAFSGEWGFLHSGQWLTFHEFTVHGAMVDELALYRAFGIPHDEATLAVPVNSSAPTVEPSRKRQQVESKWDWEGMFVDLVGVAHTENGLFSIEGFQPPKRGSQARLEDWMHDWFTKRDTEGCPSETEIRKRAAAVTVAIELAGRFN